MQHLLHDYKSQNTLEFWQPCYLPVTILLNPCHRGIFRFRGSDQIRSDQKWWILSKRVRKVFRGHGQAAGTLKQMENRCYYNTTQDSNLQRTMSGWDYYRGGNNNVVMEVWKTGFLMLTGFWNSSCFAFKVTQKSCGFPSLVKSKKKKKNQLPVQLIKNQRMTGRCQLWCIESVICEDAKTPGSLKPNDLLSWLKFPLPSV